MKVPLLVALAALSPLCVCGQGTLTFANSSPTKVYYPAGDSWEIIPVGTPNPNWVAGLYWGAEGASESSLTLIATTQTWMPLPGIFQGGTVTFPVAGGTRVTLQVRVWNVATPERYGHGVLQLITLGAKDLPINPPASLTMPMTAGDTPFSGIYWAPEPSSIALGLLGLGVIAFMRGRFSSR
jgi:hypothetical protein